MRVHSELHKAWKSEKTSELLQPLPKDFYSRAIAYLKSLQEPHTPSNVNTLQERLATREKAIIERLLTEVKQARFQKITTSSLGGEKVDPQNLTEEEKTLLEDLESSKAKFGGKHRGTQELVSSPPVETEFTIVRFLQDIPEIVGVDLKMYGPYKKEDVGSIPKQNAQALSKQGAIRSISVKPVA